MGSSNVNCSVSNLPITPQTPVRAFILASSNSMEGSEKYAFYASSFFVPITTGLVTTYYDYGRVNGNAQDKTFNIGKDHFLPGNDQELGLNDFVGKAVIPGMKDEREVFVSFVREDAYQAALKTCKMDSISRADLKAELEEIKELRQGMFKQYEILTAAAPEFDVKGYVNSTLPTELNIRKMMGVIKSTYAPQLAAVFVEREGDRLNGSLKPYKGKLYDMIDSKAAVDDELLDYASSLIELVRFDLALRILGTRWQPTLSLYNDPEVYSLHQTFNKAIGKICAAEMKAREEADRDCEVKAVKPKKKSPAKKSPAKKK